MSGKDTYWTVGKGTRNEYRVKRCGVCGVTQTYAGVTRPGPCPYKALHKTGERP